MATIYDELILVEVTPIINCTDEDFTPASPTESFASHSRTPVMSAPMVKLQLIHLSRQSKFSKGWLNIEKRVQSKSRRINHRGKNKSPKAKCDDEKFLCRRGLWMRPDCNLDSTSSDDNCKYPQEDGGGLSPLVETDLSKCHHGTQVDDISLLRYEADESGHFRKVISGTIYFIGKENDSKDDHYFSLNALEGKIPLTFLTTDDPLDDSEIPCILKGYIFATRTKETTIHHFDNIPSLEQRGTSSLEKLNQYKDLRCIMCDGTALQILPPIDMRQHENVGRIGTRSAGFCLQSHLSDTKCLEDYTIAEMRNISLQVSNPISGRTSHPLLSFYDSDTIAALASRMSAMAKHTIWIGTTARSLDFRRVQKAQCDLMKHELETFWDSTMTAQICGRQNSIYKKERDNFYGGKQSASRRDDSAVPLLLREGALLIHNSQPNSGKTALVAAVAKNILNFDAVHILSAPALFAKYGTNADIALETILHELALRGGLRGSSFQSTKFIPKAKLDSSKIFCKKGKVCVILDHFETFIPPSASSQKDGDPYRPVLNSMGEVSYILSFALPLPLFFLLIARVCYCSVTKRHF